jgi:hypothetical protein
MVDTVVAGGVENGLQRSQAAHHLSVYPELGQEGKDDIETHILQTKFNYLMTMSLSKAYG